MKLLVINVILVLGLHARFSSEFDLCATDADCSLLEGSTCRNGDCLCPVGKQPIRGGTVCGDIAPYHTSTCSEDFQCSRLVTNYYCRKDNLSEAGSCFCNPGFHYFQGRCWSTVPYEGSCSRDEECFGVIRDPYSLSCVQGTCVCAEGYYSRQDGECRKIARAVGDRCVLDDDCQFQNGICNIFEFTCYDSTATEPEQNVNLNKMASISKMANITKTAGRQLNQECDAANPCGNDFDCFNGACICRRGYYALDNSGICYAELGSPSTTEQCIGLLAEVFDGICTCPNNFYFEDDMRDCIKVSRTITDSCIVDQSCHTFGTTAICGAPQPPWGMRSCECDSEQSVWDTEFNICRFFSGIGESCEEDSDCLAGELTIQCVANNEGVKLCTCPEGYTAEGGLCLTSGLGLGDQCQATSECTATENMVCNGQCICDNGYSALDGACAPIIGGGCTLDTDCVINNTACITNDGVATCQCDSDFVNEDDVCWPKVAAYDQACIISAQCFDALNENSVCLDGRCQCAPGHHFRDGRCWPMIGLFQACARTSECYLNQMSEMVVCRNGYCACDFEFPYDEQLGTCTSSANIVTSSLLALLSVAFYLVIVQ